MAGTRALFASLGASAALVAAAAFSLLAVSAVFAFTGLGGGLEEPAHSTALVLDLSLKSDANRARAGRIVGEPLRLDAPPPPQRPASSGRTRGAGTAVRDMSGQPLSISPAKPTSSAPAVDPSPGTAPPAPPAPPAPVAVKPLPRTGDAVRRVGEGLSSGVQGAATAVGQITAPLAPPVSQAVQDVLNVVAALLRRTTNGLGGVLGAQP